MIQKRFHVSASNMGDMWAGDFLAPSPEQACLKMLAVFPDLPEWAKKTLFVLDLDDPPAPHQGQGYLEHWRTRFRDGAVEFFSGG